jgi:hypothetical protein
MWTSEGGFKATLMAETRGKPDCSPQRNGPSAFVLSSAELDAEVFGTGECYGTLPVR